MLTFCIPSKNNLRYLKTCIPSIQQNSYYKSNNILIYIDEDTDGTEDWLKENGISYIKNTDGVCKGIGNAYDILIKEATTEMVVIFHTDMLLGYHADYYLLEAYKPKSVVCATRIEPPLHPPGPEKIVKDFGIWPEDIKWEEFDLFVKNQIPQNEGKCTKALFAPWLINRNDHLGHDDIFKSIYEDADIFRRFVLAEYEIIQVWSSLVYHLTCRSSKFEAVGNNTDFGTQGTEEWQKKNYAMALEYIRKWGGMFKEYGPCEPRPNLKYDVGLEVKNCSTSLLAYEPYTTNMQVDCSTSEYIEQTQKQSSFNISSKFVQVLVNDIKIFFDNSSGSVGDLEYVLTNVEDILEQTDANSTYEFGTVTITVNQKQVHNPIINLNESISNNS